MENYKKYKIDAHLPGGMCCPYYDGNVEIYAENEEDAIERAKRKIWKTHPGRKINIDNVRRIYT